MLRSLATEIGNDNIQWREVNVLEDLDYAVALSVLATPAIAIDGKLVFTGLPAIEKLRTAILDCLGNEK